MTLLDFLRSRPVLNGRVFTRPPSGCPARPFAVLTGETERLREILAGGARLVTREATFEVFDAFNSDGSTLRALVDEARFVADTVDAPDGPGELQGIELSASSRPMLDLESLQTRSSLTFSSLVQLEPATAIAALQREAGAWLQPAGASRSWQPAGARSALQRSLD